MVPVVPDGGGQGSTPCESHVALLSLFEYFEFAFSAIPSHADL